MSDALGYFVPVLAQSNRWERAPKLTSRSQRSEARRSRYALYVRLASRMPGSPSSVGGTLPVTATSERRRDLERHPAVDPLRHLVHRAEEVGGLPEIVEGQLEEERLARPPGRRLVANGSVVVLAVRDRAVEDRGVGGESGDRELLHVTREGTAREECTRDVVEPDALARIVESLGCLHASSVARAASSSAGRSRARTPAGRDPGAPRCAGSSEWRRR